MEIIFTKQNIDEISAEAAVLTFFSDEKPLQGDSGLLDWRMNGFISQQIQKKRITGKFQESILIPASAKVAIEKIFLFGMGSTAPLEKSSIDNISEKIISTLAQMQTKKFIFILSRNIKDQQQYLKLLNLFFTSFCSSLKETEFQIFYHQEDKNEIASVNNLKGKGIKIIKN